MNKSLSTLNYSYVIDFLVSLVEGVVEKGLESRFYHSRDSGTGCQIDDLKVTVREGDGESEGEGG